jgi:lauroyl/myristoyl acyltransferase
MHFIIETAVLSIMYMIYWCNRERRKYLKKRIGTGALLNIYHTARNFSFMLQRKELSLKGNTHLLHRGCILYSFHFGIWELMPATLRKRGYRLGIIVNSYYNKEKNLLTHYLDKFLHYFRSHSGVEIFYKEDVVKIIKFIKSGGLLGILVDGNTFYTKYGKVQKLAHLCGVPLVPFVAYRHNGRGILEIGCNLTTRVKQRPSDYVWAYKSRANQQA